MKSVICVLLLVLCAFVVAEVGEVSFTDPDDTETVVDDINMNLTSNICYYIVIESCNFVCILITTVYVMSKVKTLLTDQQHEGQSTLDTTDSSIAARGITQEMLPYMQLSEELLVLQTQKPDEENLDLDEEDEVTFKDVLQHPKAFELFVHHVAKEFSIECILSLVEFTQFKQYMFNHMKLMRSFNDIKQKSIELHHSIQDHKVSLSKSEMEIDLKYTDGNEETGMMQEIAFPSTVPKSEIVYEDDVEFESNDFIMRAKHKVYRLYCKYIRLGCDLEINISHRSRQALVRMMDDEEKWMTDNKYQNLDAVFLLHIFDKCISQMRSLLQSSFARFKHSRQFAKLAQCVFVVGSPK